MIYGSFKSVAIVVSVVLVAIFLIGGVAYITAEFRGQVGQRERIVADPDYRIAAYDEFYSMCSSIDSKNQTIANQQAQLEMTQDPDQKEILSSGILAAQNSRDETIAEYNSKAEAEGTRGQFRASELPYQIDYDEEEVSCGS